MNCFKRAPPITLPEFSAYKGAGCLFTDGKSVIAGYQPNKICKGITGFGGSSHESEHWLHTAHRETIEELFETKIVPEKLLKELAKIKSLHIECSTGYVVISYTFKDLKRFLYLARWYGVTTFLYDRFPRTLADLLLTRKVSIVAEVQQLCLLPFVEEITVLREFQHDVQDLIMTGPKLKSIE